MPDVSLALHTCMARVALCVSIPWMQATALLGNHQGDSNRQKSSGQPKLEASNSQDSMELCFSVSDDQKCVLWCLEEELEQLANCTLENDKPPENSKV